MRSLILIILVIIPEGVWSGDWRVTFKNQCALKGTSVVIKCEYDYPFGHIVRSVSWSKAQFVSGQWELLPLQHLPSPPNHFIYVGNYRGDCRLKINDVQHSDRGAYFFSFVTTLGRWRSKSFAEVSVKDLTTSIEPSTVTEGETVRLTCVSGCPTPVDVVWFRDGHPVSNPVFQANRKDAGSYHCAVLGQESVKSAPVALNVQYVPRNVLLSVSPPGDVIKGNSVTFTCSSDANPPVTQSGYRLYKDGHLISSGQNHTVSDLQPSHSGRYCCQAWNNISHRGISFINSTEIQLDVQYGPMNISVSMDPPHVVEGSSVNLTCSSAANPAAHNYSWYKRTASPSSTVQVGSGQVLSLPSVEASHSGLYLCQARNPLGESNSTEVLLSMRKKEQGSQSHAIFAGVGVSLLVTLVLALLLFWRKQGNHAWKKTVPLFRLRGRSSSSSDIDETNSVYANIQMSPSSPPHDTDIASQAQSPHLKHDVQTSNEDEVTYSTVTIKPRNCPPQHSNSSRSEAEENDNTVIYTTVAKFS